MRRDSVRDPSDLPLLTSHVFSEASVLTPEALMQEVRKLRGIAATPAPPICVLDFDGDLFDGLLHDGRGSSVAAWACFHTPMVAVECGGSRCGVIPRTIGGPFAVLVAEQLHAAGARVIVGLTSAGRVAPSLPMPSIVVADEAIRDEGTSLHYLAPAARVAAPTPDLLRRLTHALSSVATVTTGLVWTTDAPYRETKTQVRRWAEAGALAVEMQAASLFAFAAARQATVAVVAMVSNGGDHIGDQFDTGEHAYRVRVLEAIVSGAEQFLTSATADNASMAKGRA